MPTCEACDSGFELAGRPGDHNRVFCYVCTKDGSDHLKFKNSQLKKKYGISLFEYNRMISEQGGKCPLCSTKLALTTKLNKGSKRSRAEGVVDHCHTTNRVRGVICYSCNVALGHVNDNPDTLLRMISYLR